MGEIVAALRAEGIQPVSLATSYEPEVHDVDRVATRFAPECGQGDFLLAIGGGASSTWRCRRRDGHQRESPTVNDYLENVGRG